MDEQSGFLEGKMLIAMPQMADPRFARTVLFLCAHSNEGAMGLVVNKLVDSITFPDLLHQLNIEVGGVGSGCFGTDVPTLARALR